MGLVAEPQRSSVQFKDPKDNTVFNPISNKFINIMHQFNIEFAFKFDPKKGVGGKPAAKESWEVGIVQNVIYEKMRFEYSDGAVFKGEFEKDVLDSAATIHHPFYHDPVYMKACELDPILSCQKYIDVMVPVVDIWQTSQGYGELLDPWDPTGVAISNNPQSVNMIDEPRFGARLRRGRDIITVAEHIVAFYTALVAKHETQVHVLASIDTFSMVSWVTTEPDSGMLTLSTPAFKYGFYGQQGITRTVRRSGNIANPNVRVRPGGRMPVMGGQTANDRGWQWLRENNLLPS